MDHSIYSYSLCIALPLMLFFGVSFLYAKTPEKAIFDNYLRSRRIMGLAMLLLSANYAVHLFFGVRFRNVNAAILMNMSTYFLCYWLFSSALMTLLDRFYITRNRLRVHIGTWILFSFLSSVVILLLPDGAVQNGGLFILAAWLVSYGFFLARRLFLAYRRAVRLFDNSHSDDVGAYIRWLSVFTYWALVFGVGCGLLTFLPDDYVFIWILSSVPFYIYLYHCYQNYLLFYEQVENVIESESPSDDCADDGLIQQEMPSYCNEIEGKLADWISVDGYVRQGLTIKDLSETLHTNRTYLSGYIKMKYGMSFREWITSLRIKYAKRRMLDFPRQTIAEISESSGFLSPSHFMKTFKDKEGCSPARWRKANLDIDKAVEP